MKKIILIISFLSNACFATIFSGAEVIHPLKCSSKFSSSLGVEVRLQIITQALSPQYNIRSIVLVTKAIAPNAKFVETQLSQYEQTAYNAIFVGKNIKVELDKDVFKADLSLGSNSYFCQ